VKKNEVRDVVMKFLAMKVQYRICAFLISSIPPNGTLKDELSILLQKGFGAHTDKLKRLLKLKTSLPRVKTAKKIYM